MVKPGDVYPTPIITDDIDRFPVDVGRIVLEWLRKGAEEHGAIQVPSDQIVGGETYRSVNPLTGQRFQVLTPAGERNGNSEVGTKASYEFVIRTFQCVVKRTGNAPVLCDHHYLGAIDVKTKWIIVLRDKPLWTVPRSPMV